MDIDSLINRIKFVEDLESGSCRILQKIADEFKSLRTENARLRSVNAELQKRFMDTSVDRNLLQGVINEQQSPAVAAPEFNGWYCAQCQCGVDPSEVTYHETHTACGRYITDDVPPTSPRITERELRELVDSYRNYREDFAGAHFSDWFKEIGRTLLNKLNGDHNGK